MDEAELASQLPNVPASLVLTLLHSKDLQATKLLHKRCGTKSHDNRLGMVAPLSDYAPDYLTVFCLYPLFDTISLFPSINCLTMRFVILLQTDGLC